MALAEHGSTPAVLHSSNGTSATATSASFSPPAGSLVVVLADWFWSGTPSATTMSVADSAAVSYTAGPSQFSAASFALTGIFWHYYASAPGSITVTVTRSGDTTTADCQLAARVLTGASSGQPGGSHAATGSSTALESSVTTTVTGSWVYVAGAISQTVTLTADAQTTTIETWQEPNTDTGGVGRQASPTGTPGATTFGWTSSVSHAWSWAGMEVLPVTNLPGTAALSGSGTLSGAGVFAGSAALSGTGTLSGTPGHLTSHGHGTAALDGNGTLNGAATGVFIQAGPLDGEGTLNATWIGVLLQPPAVLSGSGSLQLSGVKLGFTAGLSGNGTLSVLQATGGLVFATPGAAVPTAYPLSSQVMVAPPGTAAWVPLGSLGAVTALTYSFTCPGGADTMTCTVMVPAAYRTQLFNPGWQVRITRGGHTVWTGKLDEPQPATAGWTLTAVGTGNRGTDYLALYTDTWPRSEPDEAINAAIARGLPWQNPGIGTPSGAWYGQAVDTGAQTITALLNLVCTRGGLTWYVNSQPGGIPGDDLSVFPLPTTVTRLLVCTQPVARTLGGDINTIVIRYQATADNSSSGGTAATFAVTTVTNAQSVTAHGVIETYIDLSDVGVQTQAAAQAVGTKVLSVYQRASFSGPFVAHYGQLLNTGGVPIDPGCDQASTVVKLILTDYSYGGEVTPQFPVTFTVGSYTWDDFAQVATIVPYQNVDQSLTGLLSLANTELVPIAAAGG